MRLLDGVFSNGKKKRGVIEGDMKTAPATVQEKNASLEAAKNFSDMLSNEMKTIAIVSDLLGGPSVEKEKGFTVLTTAPISWLDGRSLRLLFAPGGGNPVSAEIVEGEQ